MELIEGLYILKGKRPVPANDSVEWTKQYRYTDRNVDVTKKDNITVSTVFLGADFTAGRDPVLFETRVFEGPYDGLTERYLTWEGAEKGHKEICKIVFREEVKPNG